MKVVICSPLLSYPGHFLRITLEKALCMKNAGLDVTVVGFREESGAEFRRHNLPYVSVNSMLPARARRFMEAAGRLMGIARIVVVENFLVNRYAVKYARLNLADIIFLTDVEPWIVCLLARFGLMRRRDNIIGFFPHGFFNKAMAVLLPFFSYWRARLNHWLMPAMPRLIDIICDNQFHVSGLFGKKTPRIHIIPEGYSYKGTPKEEKQAARRRFGLPPDKKVLLFCGVATETKTPTLVYEALEGLEPDFIFLIVGTIVSIFRPRGGGGGRGLDHWGGNIVRVPGFIPEDLRNAYFSACDAIILPYCRGFDTSSGSLHDAVNYGKAIIASDQYQIGHLVNNYRLGLGFAPEDVAGMRRAMRAFALKPEEWFGEVEENCRKLALENSWEEVGEIYRKTFENILLDSEPEKNKS